MDKAMKMRLLAKENWFRLFFMVIYAIVNYVVQMLVWVITAVQFIITLIVGHPNKNLVHFGEGLSDFSYHILKYLTYNIDDKPFPFCSWPCSKKEVAKSE